MTSRCTFCLVTLPRTATWIACVLLCMAQDSFASDKNILFRFKNGDHISGTIVDCDQPAHMGIQCDAFERPMLAKVSSLEFWERKEQPLAEVDGEYTFMLRNHSTLVGQLVALNEQSVAIRSRSLGDITVPRVLLNEMSDAKGVGLFVGPHPGQQWNSRPKQDAWSLVGGTLTTSLAGHQVECDLQLPALSEVRVKFSWSKAPGFVISLGTPAGGQPNRQREPAVVRIESWGSSLIMVRSGITQTDFVKLGELSTEGGRIDLVLYINQLKGEVTACTPTGKVLGKLIVDDRKFVASHSMLKLLNTRVGTNALRLERIQVRQWGGRVPGEARLEVGSVVDVDGQTHSGTIERFDAETQSFALLTNDKQTDFLELKKVGRAIFGVRSEEDGTYSLSEETLEIQFADGCRCVALWKSLAQGKLQATMEGVPEPITATLDQIIAVSGSSEPYTTNELAGRPGVLLHDQLKLTGCLSESSMRGALIWQPACSATANRLSQSFEGKISYEKETPKPPEQVQPQARGIIRINNGAFIWGGMGGGMAQIMGGGMGGDGLQSGVAVPSTPYTAGLKFRTGDFVAGEVQKIDDQGITFKLVERTIQATHADMEYVTLADLIRIPELAPEKLKHLMTIPRSAKKDPPTHLFVAANGDYLRGRLVKFENGRVTAEIRLENVEFPTDAIAQIFWLHSRDWDDKKPEAQLEQNADDKEAPAQIADGHSKKSDAAERKHEDAKPFEPSIALLQVYALDANEKAVTFIPTAASSSGDGPEKDTILKGENALLGEFEIRIGGMKSLLIGRDVGAIARKTQKDAWNLSIAPLPRVFEEGTLGVDANGSPLVGKPAPEFSLETIAKREFSLGQLKGKVTVLDFWASWCGPCMQTMPEIDRIVKEIGGDQVELVAVNLQETRERAQAAVKRLNLTSTVVLDIDGEVAQQYQATSIPQTVIIDCDGNVRHVFAGGGAKFLKQFEEALTAILTSRP